MRRTIIVVTLVVLFALGARALRPTGRSKDEAGQFAQLLTEKNAALYSRQSSAAPSQSRLRDLEAELKHFLNDHPQHVGAMVSYGEVLAGLDREAEAVTWWQKALVTPAAGPPDELSQAHAYNNLGQYSGENGHAADALRYHQRACELAPNESMFHYNWALTCSLFRNEAHEVYGWSNDEVYQHSLDEYRKAREMAPGEFSFARGYAEALYLMPQRDWTLVYDAWKFCLEQQLDPKQRQHLYAQLALASVNLQRNDEARQWLVKIDDKQYLAMRNSIASKLPQSDP